MSFERLMNQVAVLSNGKNRGVMKLLLTCFVACAVTTLSGTASHATVITFTDPDPGMSGFANYGEIPNTYQPLAAQGITITYSSSNSAGVGVFDAAPPGGGPPDHTSGVAGSPNYYAFAYDGSTMNFGFSAPVNIPSLWFKGFNGDTSFISLTAYSDAGMTVVYSNNTLPDNPTWTQFTGLAGLNNIRQLTLFSSDAANIDDITVNSVPEPASITYFALGAIGLFWANRRRGRA